MEVKKNPKANLETIRGSLLLLGVVISLIFVFILFGASKTNVKIDELYGSTIENPDEEMILITRPKPQKPKPIVKNVPFEIEVVKNEVIIEHFCSFPIFEEDTIFEFIDVFFEDEKDNKGDPVFTADIMPKFPGGENAMNQFILNNYEYPELAIENDIEGTVYVRFVVNTSGKVTKVIAANKVDPLLEEEAIRVIKLLPDFSPGIQNGHTVDVWMTVPFEFVLLK